MISSWYLDISREVGKEPAPSSRIMHATSIPPIDTMDCYSRAPLWTAITWAYYSYYTLTAPLLQFLTRRPACAELGSAWVSLPLCKGHMHPNLHHTWICINTVQYSGANTKSH
jgi:hypothetical protein